MSPAMGEQPMRERLARWAVYVVTPLVTLALLDPLEGGVLTAIAGPRWRPTLRS